MTAAPTTLLLVEDNADDSFLFSIALSAQGSSSLQTVPDGSQAIHYLQGRGLFPDRRKFPLPDIIVLDLKMPNIDGFEFLRWRTTSRFVSIPVVVLEGSGRDADRQRAQAMGAIRTFSKPCGLERLCEIVHEICALSQRKLQQSSALGVMVPPTENPQSVSRLWSG
jgi:CheY-like chemotaxis protein